MKTKSFLMAAFASFAMVFTFSCSLDDNDDGGSVSSASSSSSAGVVNPVSSSSSAGVVDPVSSSSEAEVVEPVSSSSEAGVIDPVSSSSEEDDGTYKTATIGTQVWMAKNLNIDVSGSACYDNNPANCAKHGRLYDWEAAMKACPDDWHLPSYSDINALIKELGNIETAAAKLKAQTGWNDSVAGTDNYGFSAFPSGIGYNGMFGFANERTSWWTSYEFESMAGHFGIENDYEPLVWTSNYKEAMFSVRCLKN